MKELIRDVIIALIIVIGLSFIFKPTLVKESSMDNTLHENNYLILYKLAYLNKDHPKHGDIIVFKSGLSKDNGHGTKLLIKRVIGVEGDVITIANGDVYINDQLLYEDYVFNDDGTKYTDGEIIDFVVPENEVFVMGDHRNISLDSRSPEVGTISEDNIIGKAIVRLFPFNEIRTF